MISFEEVMQTTRGISGSPALEDEDARGLYDAVATVPAGGLLVEVGCQLGRSSSLIAQLQQAIGFHSVHIDPYTSQTDYLKQWTEMMHRVGGDFTHEFTLLCMRTEQADWMLERLGPIDLAFIDGDHCLPGVLADLRLVAERVRVGGLLTAHDYAKSEQNGLVDVKAAIDPYIASGKWDEVGVFGSLGVWRRK